MECGMQRRVRAPPVTHNKLNYARPRNETIATGAIAGCSERWGLEPGSVPLNPFEAACSRSCTQYYTANTAHTANTLAYRTRVVLRVMMGVRLFLYGYRLFCTVCLRGKRFPYESSKEGSEQDKWGESPTRPTGLLAASKLPSRSRSAGRWHCTRRPFFRQ